MDGVTIYGLGIAYIAFLAALVACLIGIVAMPIHDAGDDFNFHQGTRKSRKRPFCSLVAGTVVLTAILVISMFGIETEHEYLSVKEHYSITDVDTFKTMSRPSRMTFTINDSKNQESIVDVKTKSIDFDASGEGDGGMDVVDSLDTVKIYGHPIWSFHSDRYVVHIAP